jgi:hypothetical protein
MPLKQRFKEVTLGQVVFRSVQLIVCGSIYGIEHLLIHVRTFLGFWGKSLVIPIGRSSNEFLLSTAKPSAASEGRNRKAWY